MMLHYDIECPNCKIPIHIPFMQALEAKAIENYDMLESDAQTKWAWINRASLWQLFKLWWERKHAIAGGNDR